MYKVSISILRNDGTRNFHWEVTSEDTTTRDQLADAMEQQFDKAQRGAQRVIDGAKIGRIKPTNRVVFSVQKFDDIWEEIPVAEQLAQLGNIRLFCKSSGAWKPNNFRASIDFVLDVIDF
jgi:hypothetical protein